MAGNALAVVVLLVLCLARFSSGSYDPATHVAVSRATTTATGTEEKLAGLDVYVSGSVNSPAAVVLISDVFGWKAPLYRKLADKIASNGYYVVAPDFFYGDPIVNLSDISAWILKHPQDASVEPAKKVVTAVQAKGISSVGVAGFCWGTNVAIRLANANPGLVKSVAQLHPSGPTGPDYAAVVTPIIILASPTDQVQNFTSVLKSRKQEHVKVFVKIFKDVVHGWTVRYNESDPKEVYRANRAHGLLLKWFHKYLHL